MTDKFIKFCIAGVFACGLIQVACILATASKCDGRLVVVTPVLLKCEQP